MFDPSWVFSNIGLDGFKKILDVMQECVWVGDADERTVYANPAFCRLVGYSLEEMLGEKSYIFWDEESAKTVEKQNQRRKKGETSMYHGNLKSKTGEIIPVSIAGTPLPTGGTVGISTDLRELTNIKRLRDHLQGVNAQKDDFISLVSHELRTPMTVVKGYLSMILEGDLGEIPDAVRTALESSYEGTDRMIELVNDMLDLSKIERGDLVFRKEDVDSRSLLEEVFRDMEVLSKIRKLHFKLDTEIESDHYVIWADRNRVKQLLINLINNAFKFTPEGGTVTLIGLPSDHGIRYAVRDTGIGIPKDKVDKVFDKFYQIENGTKNEHSLGLGLALCQTIAEKHGSKIGVVSEEGKGTEFFLDFRLGRSEPRDDE